MMSDDDNHTELERRKWVPDIAVITDQLITDYRSAERDGDLDALSTMDSWQATAQAHGDEFTGDDWMALVQELAQRAAGGEPQGHA